MSNQQIQSLTSPWTLFKQAVSFYKSHFSLIFGISLIPLAVSIAEIFLSDLTPLIGILLIVIFYLSKLALFAALAEENSTISGSYKKSLSFFFPFIFVGLLTALAALGGFLLLIIPGIIICIYVSQSTYVLFTEGHRGRAALVKSWHYVKGRGGKVFWRLLFLGLLLILVSVVLALATDGKTILTQIKETSQQTTTTPAIEIELSKFSQIVNEVFNNLISVPLSIIYGYVLFEALKSTRNEVLTEEREHQIKKKVTIFIILGLVAIVALTILFGTLLIRLFSDSQLVSLLPNSHMFSTIGISITDYIPFGK